MPSTKLLYFEDFSLLESNAQVLEVAQENDKRILILDQTVFYPQGGGQPFDTGMIMSSGGKFLVAEVRHGEAGAVRHIGNFEHGSFAVGETVRCIVDAKRRKLHSRIHSAGHLVDGAVQELQLGWTPGKGYHFPNGPYVEYGGTVAPTEKDTLKRNIETFCNAAMQQDIQPRIVFMPPAEMREKFPWVPKELSDGALARIIYFNDFGVPCGGTHVQNLLEIEGLTIRNIKQEGARVRVGYDISHNKTP